MSTEQIAPPQPADMNAEQVAEAIGRAWGDFVNKDSRPPSKRANVYASSYKECDRQMVLDMTHGDTLPAFDADTLARFRRGNDRERDLMADLKKIGRNCEPAFEVVGEQERFELKDHKGRVVITGKVDGRLQFQEYKVLKFLHGQRSAPVEAKGWNPNLVAKINTFDDLFASRWTRAGAYQLLSYVFAINTPIGFLLLDRSGLPALIPVELYPNLERVEKFLIKASHAMDHKEAGTLPDYTTQKEECKYCPHFGRNCNPPISYGAGAQVFTDEGVIESAERLVELETKLTDEEWTEYNRLEKWKGTQFRGVETGIVGGLLITGKWKKKKELVIPPEKLADFNTKTIAYAAECAKYQVEKAEGSFSVQLLRVSDAPPAPAKEPEEPKKRKKTKET